MILTAHQPLYLPWLGLFHKAALADGFCLVDSVQYLPKEFMNRNRIKTPQGPMWLTVPVQRKGYRDKETREIEINNVLDWRRKHWKALQINYGKAPYFSRYADFFEDVYKRDWQYIAQLNEHILRWLFQELGIKGGFWKTSELGVEGKKSDFVLDMCKKLGAELYIFGALGKDYAKKEDFAKAGIKLYFQDYQHPVYQQLHGEFLSHMSIVDLLFNHGPRSLEILMEGNITKEKLERQG
ncbi:MAG: hypothetical protein A3D64_01350 [Candidatus Wildermuthbacteria bacterium RIFCSPHIGHO2_02_FULL_49_9]|uniref:WbqC-like protein n=1 Tax=Candidatus Wildermuthbacteria bacterium RIFCSPHIGHO2_02_FULL_49_9 TaxID=1802456 RepID=A0A1G2RDN9_9BACT|nr:MAG: hypothetical protein A3D64_01350 [Candidatus Wildermuthbacteria bacterium RIFCSPHIGHO2_02_FULL_49_9]